MNIQSKKKKIKQGIDAIDNEMYLEAINNLVNDALYTNLRPSTNVISIVDYIQRALQSEAEIDVDNVKSLEEVIRVSKSWQKKVLKT